MVASDQPLAARRSSIVDTERLRGVVVEVDATEHLPALAVLQAGLHDPPEGTRLIHGYDVEVVGLGAWVGDRRVRVSIWPAYLHASGDITAEDPEAPDADVLVIDIDPLEHGEALTALADHGRLLVAGPEAGPTPLVVDLDPDLVRRAFDDATRA